MPSSVDRREAKAQQRMAERRFADPEVQELLADLTVEELEWKLGRPVISTVYAEPKGYWAQGQGRPALADDDPAVMQAIGRCAASRVRGDVATAVKGRIHPAPCGWCEFPLEQLLAACDWAVFTSRYVVAELATWSGFEGSTYTREMRSDVYDNPRWREWYELPRQEKADAIAEAAAA